MTINQNIGRLITPLSNEAYSKHILSIEDKCKYAMDWITGNLERNDETLLIFNFLSAIKSNLAILRHSNSFHVSMLALSTRNLFELNLHVRDFYLDSNRKTVEWSSEAITDYEELLIKVLKRLIKEKDGIQITDHLNSTVSLFKGIKQDFELLDVKLTNIYELAKRLNLEEEYITIYKLSSKLIHPTSLVVNNYAFCSSGEITEVLQVYAQKYAHESISRVIHNLQIPENT